MGIIETLLEEMDNTSDIDEQVKRLCDQIYDEEREKISNSVDLPKGPNVFIALEVPGRFKKETAYLALDRESPEKYIIVLWTKHSSSDSLKKSKVWEVTEVQPAKILKEYAKIIKFMRGE